MQRLRDALELGPVEVFFRDDDAGWEDARLLELIARFEGFPLDLAVIPMELTERLAGALEGVGCHQHGYAHTNHQLEGRKCEFGPARSKAQQRDDIAAGRERLSELLGDRLDPFFTPPWNRCTRDTGEVLRRTRLHAALARAPGGAARAAPRAPGPPRRRAAYRRNELDERFAGFVRAGGPVGVMFHHGVMEPPDMAFASELLTVLQHPNVTPRRMADLCP